MNNRKTFSNTLIILLISVTFVTSCSSDEDYSSISLPSISYTTTNIEAEFFKPGNTSAPETNWGGNKGSFSLATQLTGLSIDHNTGVLSWTKDLPIGTQNIDVIATNSTGSTTVMLTINNSFQGVLLGTYTIKDVDGTFYYKVEFKSDNKVIVTENNDTVGDYDSFGTWTKDGSIINIDYTSSFSGNDFSLGGILATGTEVVYSGDWYIQWGSVIGNEGGTFEVELQ